MARAMIAVILSYLLQAVLIMALFLGVVLALGVDGTLRPGEYWTTGTFNAIVLTGGTIIAALCGRLCAAIARSWKPALVVAGLMLVFGLFGAIGNMNKPDPPAREAVTGEGSQIETTMKVLEQTRIHGKEPLWFSIAAPLLGAAAFVAGARIVKPRAGRPSPGPAAA